MDAVAYQMSFDKEQLALLCANYDRRIDSLGAENKKLKAENDKLRGLVQDMWFWSYEGHICSESQEWQMKHINGVFDRMRELGVEVTQ